MGVKYTQDQNKLYCVYLAAPGIDGKSNGRYFGKKLAALIHIQKARVNVNTPHPYPTTVLSPCSVKETSPVDRPKLGPG